MCIRVPNCLFPGMPGEPIPRELPPPPAPLTAEKKVRARALIAQFSDRRFTIRQKAVDELVKMGPAVLPLVRKTLVETKDNEVKLRCEMVTKALGNDAEDRSPAK